MISLIATALCFAFIAYLFWSDPRQEGATTFALWIPFLWMFFAGSRYLSAWLSFNTTEAFSYDEGSPLDRLVFLGLVASGTLALARRNLDWGSLLGRNKLLAIYLFYCLLSTLWSPEPSISLKRWFKDLGNPIMALIILTEPMPMIALATLVRRLSYLLLPLSVLFVRYYPELGRVYGVDGTSMYTGVGQQKNALGQLCLFIGIYFLWQVTADRKRYLDWTRKQRLCLLTLLAMLGWLQYMSNSQTALASLFVAAIVLLCTRLPAVQRSPATLVNLLIFAATTFIVLESVFGIKNVIIGLLGRDPSLTSRTDLWAVLYNFSKEPVLGAGFMSFWSGERLVEIWSRVGAGVVQAHSGYLEQYLNLGFVGLALMALLLLRALFGIRRQLRDDAAFGALRLCFLSAAVLSNYTEASFYGVNNIWIITLLAVLEVPPRRATPAGAIRSRRAGNYRRGSACKTP
jgi:O-antigen ligase